MEQTPGTRFGKISDGTVAELQKLHLEREGEALSDSEAREMLSRLFFLFERFALWIAKEKAAGREFPIDEPEPVHEDNGQPR